jgi:hypothetical protein
VRWDLVERRLETAFAMPRHEASAGRILVAVNALDLDEVLTEARETREESGEHGAPVELLEEERSFGPVLGFEWQSMGPMSWYSTLRMVDLGGDQAYACICHEEAPSLAFAAIRPKDEPGLWSALFRELVATNGSAYDVGLFGSLPGETENFRPDLVPETVVRKAYRAWLDNVEDGWWGLNEHIAAMRAYPDDLMQRALGPVEALAESLPPADDPEALDRFLEAPKRFADGLSEDARLRLLDEYFRNCYFEQ